MNNAYAGVDENIYGIWLSLACGVNSTAYSKLFAAFATAKEIYLCRDYSFINLSLAQNTALADKKLDKALEIYKSCTAGSVGMLSYDDEKFPQQLRTLRSPPPLLYYIGNIADFNSMICISFVGSRKASKNGIEAAETLAYDVALRGASVVSGIALGIDAAAHRGALKAGGYTIGFSGTAINIKYPRENEKLYSQIYESGIIFSEYYPNMYTDTYSFPVRNRLISGISKATVVVEAMEKSGALITARLAVEQGNRLYAVPAGMGTASGTNALIKNGARAVFSADDILSDFSAVYPALITKPVPRPAAVLPEMTPKEREIYDFLVTAESATPDDTAHTLGLMPLDVMFTLTNLELKGIAEQSGDGKYVIKNKK